MRCLINKHRIFFIDLFWSAHTQHSPISFMPKLLKRQRFFTRLRARLPLRMTLCRLLILYFPAYPVMNRLLSQVILPFGLIFLTVLTSSALAANLQNEDLFARHYSRGLIWTIQGNSNAAIEEFQKAAEMLPDSPDIHYQLGVAYGTQSKWQLAISELRRAIALNPTYIEARYALGRIYLKATAQSDKAITELKQVVDLNPESAQGYYLLGSAYLQQNKFEGAEVALRHALQLHPGNVEIYSELGMVYFKQKRYDAAIQILQQAIQRDQNYALTHFILGNLYLKQGKKAKGLKELQHFEQLTQQAEDIKRFRQRAHNAPNDANAWYQLGLAQMRAGKYNAAIPSFRRSIELGYPNEKPYEALGQVYFRLNAIEDAQRMFFRALEINPRSADLYNSAGICCFMLEQFDEAIQYMKQAIQLRPTDEFYLNLSKAYQQLGRIAEAEAAYKAYQELQSD